MPQVRYERELAYARQRAIHAYIRVSGHKPRAAAARFDYADFMGPPIVSLLPNLTAPIPFCRDCLAAIARSLEWRMDEMEAYGGPRPQ